MSRKKLTIQAKPCLVFGQVGQPCQVKGTLLSGEPVAYLCTETEADGLKAQLLATDFYLELEVLPAGD